MCGYRRLLRVTPHRVTSWQTKMLTYFSRFRQFLYHYEVTLHHLMPCFCWSNLILATFFRHIHPDIHPEKMCGVWPCKWETMGYLHLQIWWSQATWIIYSMKNTWEKWWNSAILAISEWGNVHCDESLRGLINSPSFRPYNSTHPFGGDLGEMIWSVPQPKRRGAKQTRRVTAICSMAPHCHPLIFLRGQRAKTVDCCDARPIQK